MVALLMRSLGQCSARLISGSRLASGWAANTWGETDRHAGWRASNWAGNEKWSAASLAEPTSVAQLQETVRAAKCVRPLGSGHSFTPLIASPEPVTMVSMRKMPRRFELNASARTVTVDAGTTYSELCAALSTTGLALPNTASLPHFSVAGAVSTGTHGSSGMGPDGRIQLSGLADDVIALEVTTKN